jgi:hypothetical protein
MNPARMCLESLDRRPGIREQPGHFPGAFEKAVMEHLPKRLAYHLERLLPASQLPKLPQSQPHGLRIGLARRFGNDAFVVHH